MADTHPQAAQSDLAAVAELTRYLRARQRFTPEEESARRRAHFRRAMTAMQERPGLTYGQATGAPGVASASPDLDVFRQAVRAIDGDLAAQLRIVAEGVQHYFEHGEIPAPYYAWRVGVLLRKAKQYELEAEFLEAFSALFGHGNGARYGQIAERAVKARSLAVNS